MVSRARVRIRVNVKMRVKFRFSVTNYMSGIRLVATALQSKEYQNN